MYADTLMLLKYFGEVKVYTNPKVSDQYSYLEKAQFFHSLSMTTITKILDDFYQVLILRKSPVLLSTLLVF